MLQSIRSGPDNTRIQFDRRSLLGDQHGGVSVLTAVTIGVLIAVAAFTIDMGFGYVTRSKLQATADASALAGLFELTEDQTTLPEAERLLIIAAAQQFAMSNMALAEHGVVLKTEDIFIGHWDATGEYGPAHTFYDETNMPPDAIFNAVQTNTRRSDQNDNPLALIFSGILGKDTIGVSATAIAAYVEDSVGDACVYALRPGERFGVGIIGAATVDLDCSVVSNSPLDQGGNSCMWTTHVYAVEAIDGDCIYSPGTQDPAPQQLGRQKDDPLCRSNELCLGEPQNYPGDCTPETTDVVVGPDEEVHLSGNTVYCGDLHIQGTAYLGPGLFHIIGGKFKVNSGAVVHTVDSNGNVIDPHAADYPPAPPSEGGPLYGQTIFLDSEHKNDVFEINGDSSSTLLAPTDPAVFNVGTNIIDDADLEAGLTGMLFYQSRYADPHATNKFNGGADMFTDGIIYAASAECRYNGGSDEDIGSLMLVCGQIDYIGTTYFYDSPINGSAADNPYLADFTYPRLVH